MIRVHYDSIDSTNTQARQLSAEHPGEWILVSSGTQTAGRGRFGRQWQSDTGGAWFTLVVPHQPDPEVQAILPLLAGLSVRQVLAEQLTLAGKQKPEIQIKWPNDVLLDGKKVAGILCERIKTGKQSAVLVGIGINIVNRFFNMDPAQFILPPVSVLEATGAKLQVGMVIQAVTEQLRLLIESGADACPRAEMMNEIEYCLAWRGHTVEIVRGSEKLTGTLMGLNPSGGLLLESGDQLHCIEAGELGLPVPLDHESAKTQAELQVRLQQIS